MGGDCGKCGVQYPALGLDGAEFYPRQPGRDRGVRPDRWLFPVGSAVQNYIAHHGTGYYRGSSLCVYQCLEQLPLRFCPDKFPIHAGFAPGHSFVSGELGYLLGRTDRGRDAGFGPTRYLVSIFSEMVYRRDIWAAVEIGTYSAILIHWMAEDMDLVVKFVQRIMLEIPVIHYLTILSKMQHHAPIQQIPIEISQVENFCPSIGSTNPPISDRSRKQ